MNTLPPHAQDDNPHEKHCSACDNFYPATTEFFYRRKAAKDGLQNLCKACRSDYDFRNREHKQATAKAYYAIPENRERHLAKEKARRNNPETCEDFRAMKRASYYRPNVQSHLKEYYSQPEVRERKRANDRKRYHDPVIGKHVQEQKRARTLSYLARQKAVQGTYTHEQIEAQLKRQKHRCYYAACGHIKFQKVNGKYVYHIDHTFPISRVIGTDIPANSIDYLVLACPTCNMSKRNKFPWEWPEGGRLL